MRFVSVLILFAAAMAAVHSALQYAVPMLPLIVVQALGWFFPGVCAGYLLCRRRALRLVSSADGSASAAALNERL